MGYYSDDITNEELNKLEKKIAVLYSNASKEMGEVADSYFSKLRERYDKEYEAFQKGAYTEAEFKTWYKTQVMRGEGYNRFRDDLANKATQADLIASSYINDKTPSIYSLNRDYEAYVIEGVTGIDWHMADEQTMRNLLTEERNATEFKTTKVNPIRDYEWNRGEIQKALASGIAQGKSIDKLSKAYLSVMKRDKASAVRNARTSFTSAQNAGRLNSYERAEEMGIKVEKQWMATLDSRTRDSHMSLDGEIVPYKDTFSNGLEYPADPSGDPAEVYNCRCTMTAVLPDYNKGNLKRIGRDENGRNKYFEGTTYEGKGNTKSYKDWLHSKLTLSAPSTNNSSISHIANYTSNMATKCGQTFYDGIVNRVNSCSNQDMIAVWAKNESLIKIASTTVKRGSCTPKGEININTAVDAVGTSWKKPYQTTFHESGHAIDFLNKITGSRSFMFSGGYKNGIFAKTIKDEVSQRVNDFDKILKAEFKAHGNDAQWLLSKGYISQYEYNYFVNKGSWMYGAPKYSKNYAYKALENEIKALNNYQKSDISDIMEGATKGKIQCGFGHGKSYWKSDDRLAGEAFAEMTSATIVNPESLQTIKNYLPQSYAIYEEMLQELSK